MSKHKILYVEDEVSLANIVKDTLEGVDYEVVWLADGIEALTTLQAFPADICLLDVMLPSIDGFSIGKQIKAKFPDLPIIFLTSKNQSSDVVEGFKSGGNDYIRKPFSLEELIVRIENLLSLQNKPSKQSTKSHFSIGAYEFSPDKLILKLNEQERKLTYRETEILKIFEQHQNEIIQRKELLLKIWGDDSLYNSRNLDVYINKVRDYLSDDPKLKILTLRGVGYRFVVE